MSLFGFIFNPLSKIFRLQKLLSNYYKMLLEIEWQIKKMIIVHRRKIMITFLTYNYLESEDRYIWPSVDEILDVKFMQFMR